MTRWNKDYPCSEKEYNELRDIDRVELDVMETLRDCGLEPEAMVDMILGIALTKAKGTFPTNDWENGPNTEDWIVGGGLYEYLHGRLEVIHDPLRGSPATLRNQVFSQLFYGKEFSKLTEEEQAKVDKALIQDWPGRKWAEELSDEYDKIFSRK